jgi:superfamily II DNA helicase RecQ
MASNVTMEDVKRVLQENFRLKEFRANQEEVISRLLFDNQSACAVMPTGN